jgi:hypothetical protein
MKIASLIFTILLFFAVILLAASLRNDYKLLVSFGVNMEKFFTWNIPNEITIAVYLVNFIAALYLHFKRKYLYNIIFSGVMMILLFHLGYWITRLLIILA